MRLRLSCQLLHDGIQRCQNCLRLTGGIGGEGGGTGGQNAPRRWVEDSGTSSFMALPERVHTIYHKVVHTIRKV
jgi:hypothetical protein